MWDAIDAAERALQAQLLTRDDDGYRYQHDLARSAVAASLAPDRRRLIHKQLAATLQERRGRAERIALHLEAAEEPAAAVAWRLRAADEASRRFARNEACPLRNAIRIGNDPSRGEAILARINFGARRLRAGVSAVAADLAGSTHVAGVDDEA